MNEEMKRDIDALVPKKAWFSLKEVCALKNLCYKTSCNKTSLQPLKGKPDGKIGGKKMWLRMTLISWLTMTDQDIEGDATK
jgi:hypothetical protein